MATDGEEKEMWERQGKHMAKKERGSRGEDSRMMDYQHFPAMNLLRG